MIDELTNQERFIYNQVYNGCKNKRLKDSAAHDAAINAVTDYKRHKFKTGLDLIQNSIKKAVIASEKENKNGNVRKN